MGAKKYAQEVIKEGKRVRWPKKDEFLPTLVVVIVVCVVCALILSLWDLIGQKLIDLLNNAFENMKGEIGLINFLK